MEGKRPTFEYVTLDLPRVLWRIVERLAEIEDQPVGAVLARLVERGRKRLQEPEPGGDQDGLSFGK